MTASEILKKSTEFIIAQPIKGCGINYVISGDAFKDGYERQFRMETTAEFMPTALHSELDWLWSKRNKFNDPMIFLGLFIRAVDDLRRLFEIVLDVDNSEFGTTYKLAITLLDADKTQREAFELAVELMETIQNKKGE